MLAPDKNLSKFTLLSLLSVIILTSFFLGHAELLGQEKNALTIAKARIKLYSKEFTQAIELLNALLQNTDITTAQKKDSYEIIAASYLSTENSIEAENSIKKILEENPDYKPITNVYRSEVYIKLVQKVREEMNLDNDWDWKKTAQKSESKKRIVIKGNGSKKKWPWIIVGAGLVGGGLAAIITLNGGGNSSDTGFPRPPERPGGN